MTRYNSYMDNITAPEELTQRLKELKAAKKPIPVYRAAGIAAALALCLGLGAWAALGGREVSVSCGETAPEGGTPDILCSDAETDTEPDIALEPGGSGSAPSPTMGGYEVVTGEGPEAVTSYFPLPRLNFGKEAEGMTIAPDYALGPLNDYTRDVTEEDLTHIFGRLYAVHLGFEGYDTLYGSAFFSDDGEACGMNIYLGAPAQTASIEILRDYDVPSCIVLPDEAAGHTDIDGVDVTAVERNDGCQVSFFVNGFGWKAFFTGGNAQELAARLVRLVLETPRGLSDVCHTYPAEPVLPEELPAALKDGAGAAELSTPSFDPNN